MINEEIRSYEVSVWTLQDEFISVLKWSNVENKGTIQDPKMILSDDGTQNFTFSIPMYIYENGILTENPIWYNTRNGNLMVNLRKIKVIFNKESYSEMTGQATSYITQLFDAIDMIDSTAGDYIKSLIQNRNMYTLDEITYAIRHYDEAPIPVVNQNEIITLLSQTYFSLNNEDETVFEFLITKITEEHESDHLFCNIECEGLAFHELGKIGYSYDFSQADIDYDYETFQKTGKWKKSDGTEVTTQPKSNINYWCEKIGLELYPISTSTINPRKWYYKILMDWSSYPDQFTRSTGVIYEDEHATQWRYDEYENDLVPVAVEDSKEKERIIEVRESNLYNITQTIAETFEVYCRYQYIYDSNYHIIGRVVVFFNNFIHDNNQDIMSLSYPYSSSKISREMDSQNIVTKLYVKSMEDSTTYLGEASIRYCNANKMQEDYIFNFDYLKETNSITQEQYDAIKQYEIDIYKVNNDLYPIENKIQFYQNKITELKAKKTVYENSVKLDVEQKDKNSELGALLIQRNSSNPSGGYIDSHNATNPDVSIISQDKQGIYCIKLGTKEKGIHTDSVKIYRQYNSASNQFIGDPLTGFTFAYDEYNNPTAIYGIAPDENLTQPNTVYLTYTFEPKLYYDAIVKVWEAKRAADQKNLDQVTAELEDLEDKLEAAIKNQESLLNNKKTIIREFNEMMGPALREGYWQPEDYQDYGERHAKSHSYSNTADIDLTKDLDNDFAVVWDTELFDEEQDIYYEEGIEQSHRYYPCVNLTNVISNNADFKANPDKYSFVFYNNYYEGVKVSGSVDITKIRSFSVGSEAILGFVRNSGGTIFPALILIGAKSMTYATDTPPIIEGMGTIGFMKSTEWGQPRISKIQTNTNNANITVSETNVYTLSSSDFLFGGEAIESCRVVFPRIRFTSLMLKTNSDDLFIRYPYVVNSEQTPLVNLEDYYIRNRRNPSNYNPEYLITLKPITMIKAGTYSGTVHIDYAISNAGTAIYLDAIEIEKENAYPKVSYTIDPSILDKKIISTLYNKLNWLVMINDPQLKFENVFGYISKLELDLDHPDKDSIEIKNYKTKFEDLFSSIIASTESLQQNSKMLSSIAAGTYSLSGEGLASTLQLNNTIFSNYVEECLKESTTLNNTLTSLFMTAGSILTDSNEALTSVASEASKNSAILSEFAANISSELNPKVFAQDTAPQGFKKGDIWLETDPSTGRVINRYLAISDAVDSIGPDAWLKTYNGGLAQIKGATMNIDTAAGTIDVLAENTLNLAAGNGDVNIEAGMDVNIRGNRNVNIGGTTINMGSLTVTNAQNQTTTYDCGGINLIAAAAGTDPFGTTVTNAAKVLISPNNIKMFGSAIEIGTQSVDSNQVIQTNGILLNSSGIKIASTAGITLFSGNAVTASSSGAILTINKDQILLGVTDEGTAAIDIKKDKIVMGLGTAITNLENNTMSFSSTMMGAVFSKDLIGLTVNKTVNGADRRTALIMNADGFMVGSVTGSGDITTGGAYVKILAEGTIDIGSNGNLKLNTNNIVLDSTASSTATVFELKRTVGSTTTSYIKYTADGKLSLTADQITLGSQTVTSQTGFEMSPEKIWLSVKGKHEDSTTGSSITLDENAIKLDVADNDYIHIDKNNGIDIYGHSVKINGRPVWQRSDIIYSTTKPNHEGREEWLWIKPVGEDVVSSSWSGTHAGDITLSGGTVLNDPSEGSISYTLVLYQVAAYRANADYPNCTITVTLQNTVATANGTQPTATLTKVVNFTSTTYPYSHSAAQDIQWTWTSNDNLFAGGGDVRCIISSTWKTSSGNTYNVQPQPTSASLIAKTAAAGSGSQCIVYYFDDR